MMAGAGARRFTVAFIATVAVAGSAAAQSVPEGQSCGGLLCDIGVFGHKTGQAGEASRPAGPSATQPVTTQPVTKVVPAPAEPKSAAVHKPKRVAKAVAPAKTVAPAKAVIPVEVVAPAPAAAVPEQASVRAAPASSVPSAPVPGAPVVAAASTLPAATAAAPEIFIPLTPYASPGPARVTLQAISPTY